MATLKKKTDNPNLVQVHIYNGKQILKMPNGDTIPYVDSITAHSGVEDVSFVVAKIYVRFAKEDQNND